MVPRIRSPWTRERLQTVCSGESLTEQSHKEAVDINNIVDRYTRSGMLPPPGPHVYGDATALQLPLSERIEFADRVVAQARAFELELLESDKRSMDSVSAAIASDSISGAS